MARVKIEMPREFIFKTEILVRISDINYGGHLGNDSVLSICHEARLRFLRHLDYSELDVEGSGIIMSDAAIQYKGESFHGDELMIEIGVIDITRVGCDFVYRITNKYGGNEIAIVKTGIVFYDYDHKKVIAIPKIFLSKLQKAD